MRSSFLFCLTVAYSAGLAGCRGCESDLPPVRLIRNMFVQERGKAYRADTSGLFADGRMMREPVEGTVAVGQLFDDEVLFEGLDEKNEPTKAFPAAVKVAGAVPDAFRARGKDRYQIYCAPCHGVAGDGKGVLTDKALDGGPRLVVPPASFYDQRLKEMVVGKMYAAIKNGVNQGNMPSYAAQIQASDRWAIVAYVRQLQRSQDPSVEEEGGVGVIQVAAATQSSAEHGAQLYKAKGCAACHSLDGARLVGPTFKGIWGRTEGTSAGDVVVDDAYVKESMLSPMAKIVNGYPPAMPPQVLSDIELGSITLFLQTLK